MEYLYNNKVESEVYGVDINEPSFDIKIYEPIVKITFENIDLLDISRIRNLFTRFVPDYILHLASFSSVAYSWKNPSASFANNTNIFLNIAETASEFNSKCRILSVGSSEEYGIVDAKDLPVKESFSLKPASPYAVARVSQEMLSKVYVDSMNLDIILTRSFNHIGPYQDTRFAVPSFISRILEIKNSGKNEGKIVTGDITVIDPLLIRKAITK